jgi:cytokinesis protein
MSTVSGRDIRTIPYDSDPAGPPIPVGRPPVTADIPASVTHPTVAASGVDSTLFTMQRARVESERAYATISAPTPRSSYSTLYSEYDAYDATTINEQQDPLASFATLTLRQSGSSSGGRSPSTHDSFGPLSPISSTPSSPPPSSSTDLSSTSSSYTGSDRPSRYAPQTESNSSHRHGTMGDFNLPRPDDGEIEIMNLVERNERLRYQDEKTREEQEGQAKKIPELKYTAIIEEQSPEWYLMKFMDRSITPRDASSLLVSLKTQEMGCVFQCFLVSGILNEDSRCRRQMSPAVCRDARNSDTWAIYLAYQPQREAEVCHSCLSTFCCTFNDRQGRKPTISWNLGLFVV